MQRVKQIIHKATDTPKKRRTGLIVLLILLVLVTGGIYYWNTHKKGIIKDELDSTLDKRTKGLYVLGYDKFELDEVGGSLLVTNLRLNYDSNVYKRLLETDDAPSILVNIVIPKLNITGVETPRALIDKEVTGDKLQLIDPLIEIVYTRRGKDSIANVPPEQVYRQLLGNLNLIRIRQLEIRNARLWTKRINQKDTSLQVDNISLMLDDVRIDDSSALDSSRILFSKNISLTAAKIEWSNRKKTYRYQVDNVNLNSAEKKVVIGKAVIDPLLSEAAFMNRARAQIDRFDILFDSIRLHNVDYRKLLKETIEADSLLISYANVKVYKDHAQPRDGVNRVGTYPHQALLKLPVSLNIRKAFVWNSYIEYKQNTPKTGMKGKVTFHNTSLVLSNITNQKEAIRANKICRAVAQTRFLNTALLKATFYFNLASDNGSFEINGQLGSFDATRLNSITEPLTAAKVEKGKINGADIKITGSDYVGNATVTLLYDDLKIAVLEKNEEDKTLDKKKLVSFAANIILKNSNPNKREKVRTTSGTFQRDTNRAFFNLVWKSLFVAISETLGAPAKTKAEPKQSEKKPDEKDDKKKERKRDRKKDKEEEEEKKKADS
jgi:hypothetical protein